MPEDPTQAAPGEAPGTSAPAAVEAAPAPESAPPQPAQAGTTPNPIAEAEPPHVERRTLRQLLAEDPRLNAEFQSQLARRVRRELERSQRKALSEQATEALSDEADPDRAREVLRSVKPLLDAPDEPDEDAPAYLRPEWRERADAVQAALAGGDRFWRREAHALAARQVVALHRQEADALWARDPEAYHDWLLERVTDHLAEGRAREATKKAKVDAAAVAEALATERTTAALRNTPAMPLGGAAAGVDDDDAFLRRHAAGDSKDHARAMRLLGLRL